MKIDSNHPIIPGVGLEKPKGTRAHGPGKASPSAAGLDHANISTGESFAANLKARIAQLPAIRQERVAALRERIQNGTYDVDSTSVADAILADPIHRKSE